MKASTATRGKAESANVTDNAQRARALMDQMTRLGLSGRELAAETGVARGTVGKALEGTASRGTYERLEAYLNDLDRDSDAEFVPAEPVKSPKEGLVEFRLSGNFGVDVVVSGPVSDLAELEAAVGRLLSKMGESHPEG